MTKPTPRTDAAFQRIRDQNSAYGAQPMTNLARQLEHELDCMTAVARQNGDDLDEVREQLAAAQAQIAALQRGEYICKSCGLRKDGEHEQGDF